MPDWSIEPTEAVLICTRNRPTALGQTLDSVAAQSGAGERLVLVIDGSDPTEATQTARLVNSWSDRRPFHYYRYPDAPAQTRQRNTGVDLLPPSVTIVHFIDDDVTLNPGYFETLTRALTQHSSLLGAGGIIVPADETAPRGSSSWMHRLFMLSAETPSQVLPSGQTTPPWPVSERALQPAHWLSTCSSSYQRSIFQRHRFDERVEGPSPTLHDLDFSYRVSQTGPLAVVPDAFCVHHRSPKNRRDVRSSSRERAVRRYWFVQKNLNTFPNRLAFWWSMLGKFLALVVSTAPESSAALRGHLQGLRTIWTRNHPLLRPPE